MTCYISTTSKEFHEITSAFEVYSKAISVIGKDKPYAAGNIAEEIQLESGIHSFKIKEAIRTESEKIYHSGYGPENRHKRVDRIKQLASVMGHKIMNKFYSDFIGFGDDFSMMISLGDDEEDDTDDMTKLVGSLDSACLDLLTFAINQKQKDIFNIIKSNAGERLSDFIEQRAELISYQIASINLISRSLKSEFYFGDLKRVIDNPLRTRTSEFASQLISGKSDDVAQQLFNTISSYTDASKKPGINLQEKAPGLIKTKLDSLVQSFIEEQAEHLSSEIVKIKEISTAIDTVIKDTNIFPGIMQSAIEYILIDNSTDIAKCVQSENAEEVATLINTPFSDTSTATYTIGKAIFGIVMSAIIKNNSEEIAGNPNFYDPSATTIREKIESVLIKRGLMQGYKRSRYMLMELSHSIANNIVQRFDTIKHLKSSLLNIFVQAITQIILDNANTIVGDGSYLITPTTIQNNVQKKVKELITDKINQLFYNFNKSIVINIQQRPTTYSTKQYELKLVHNSGQETPNLVGSGGNISVSPVQCLSGSSYICVKHTINLGSAIKETDIGGLRLHLGENEVNTYDTGGSIPRSVFYAQGENEISVYFHSRTVTHREPSGTNKRLLDKGPLLVAYNGQYYRPYSPDHYSGKWVYANVTSSSGDAGQHQQTEQLTNELNNVNKSLNRVDLENIATICDTTQAIDFGPSNTYRKCYGIPYPGTDPPETGLDKSFYDRICVKPCVTDKYRKQVHTTINKSELGDVYLHNQKVTGINNTQPQHNQVEVYYDHGDHHFSRPLLILLTTQGGQESNEQLSTTKKWYKRGDLGGTKWAPLDLGETGTFESVDSDGSALKEQLEKIASELYATLGVELEQKKEYEKQVTVKSYTHTRSNISVFNTCSNTAHKAEGYQCCEHKLYEYYTAIKNASRGQPPDADPTFVLEPQIAGIKLGIFTTNNTVSPVLTYTNTDSGSKKSLVVYFWKGDGSDSTDTHSQDPVPLMFNYNGKYYGPSSKEKYFCHWELLSISSSRTNSVTTELKQTLDKIHQMLNEINLTQTSSYGLRCCDTHPYYYKQDGFNSKRVILTKFTKGTKSHTMYVHTTLYRTKIGEITNNNSEYMFNAHTTSIKDKTINQVAVVYTGNGYNNDKPVLVLLNQGGQSKCQGVGDDAIKNSKTYGYYYQNKPRGDDTSEYKFHHIENGCRMMTKLIGPCSDDGNECQKDHITPKTITCKGPHLNGLTTVECEGVLQEESPDEADLVEVEPDVPAGDELGNLGGIGANPKAGHGARSSDTEYGPQGLRCDTSTQQERQATEVMNDYTPGLSDHSQGSQDHDSADGQEEGQEDDGDTANQEDNSLDIGGSIGHDAMSTEGLGPRSDGAERLGGSGSVDSGAKVPQGPRGDSVTEDSASSPDLGHTPTNGHDVQSQLPNGGGGNHRQDLNGTDPSRLGSSRGSEASHSAQASSGGGITAEKILDFLQQPEGYGSASAVGGVGVMGTVGAVVYKKCIVGSAVAASATSGI